MQASAQQQQWQDRRTERRRRVAIPAQLSSAGAEALACEIIDLSTYGARLRLDAGALLAPRVQLTVLSTGSTAEARVIWRIGEFVGLVFPSLDDEPPARPWWRQALRR